MEKEKATKLTSIRDAEKELDSVYQSKDAMNGRSGLDVPDATFDYGTHSRYF